MTDPILRGDQRTDSHPPFNLSPPSGRVWNLAFLAQCIPIDWRTPALLPEAAGSPGRASLPAAHVRRRGRPDRREPARTLRPGASWLLFTEAASPTGQASTAWPVRLPSKSGWCLQPYLQSFLFEIHQLSWGRAVVRVWERWKQPRGQAADPLETALQLFTPSTPARLFCVSSVLFLFSF